ncbi:hypothetical protein J3458_000959 [Metarhizium acridum]|uniref:Utp8 beta-propeller domain-containing protein n=1 Tax=Metarhizium acridum (strain CQMa 102) TaxID=655827 RepID=E9DVG7_METAQ|nr:uncharacterized protein MAC_01615 [Metarhizium acridum CQMa 102]EFY92344.1 hypothetical protein MAC_01615 [Metarhizium acridum CQMa 102]KAG8424131.1 hypothetical protein J3458_000959 [Metarhizium acridum]
MASEYKIHRPYVVATLPRPLDHTGGRIVAREVYGLRTGQKKKKRMELAVGVDGETASIYDVPASRLITSYPIPPQESFTCAPYSIRLRRSGSDDVHRYTYIATRDAKSYKITLFKDVVHPDGKTTSSTTSQTLQASPIHITSSSSTTSLLSDSTVGDVVAICEDGQVAYLSGEDLKLQWSSPFKPAIQDVIAGAIENLQVEYVSSGSVTDFREGAFKSKLEIFSALPRALDVDPSLIFLVVKSAFEGKSTRHLLVLAALPGGAAAAPGLQKLIPLDISPLPANSSREESPVYEVDIHSGFLTELASGVLSVYDITGAVPKKKSLIQMTGAQSFIRLSRPFLLTTSTDSMVLYNHQYRSVHGRADLDLSELPAEDQQARCCQLITHFRSQDLAIALIDNVLVSIHVEPPHYHGKRRKEGLLIDSIGRGTSLEVQAKRLKGESVSPEFSRLIPGSMTEEYLATYHKEIVAANEMLANNALGKWEDLLRQKFCLKNQNDSALANGEAATGQAQELPEWDWQTETGSYPPVDRRWVIYAISQVFSVETTSSDEAKPELRLALPDSNVTTYLVVAGHLTISNLLSAFRDVLLLEASGIKALARDLIHSLTDADPSMTLLLNYLQATKLGEVELLLAIRSLMLSMDLLPDTKKLNKLKLLANEAHEEGDTQEVDLDDLEREIAVTEHYLGDESSSRSRGLTLAFTKLWRIPAIATVKALRDTIRTEEVLAFIYILRVELVRGAWTTLYTDPTSLDSEGNDPPPDGVITLIADLLGRCLDAVGAGGWLFNDAMTWADKTEAGDFLTALKLEVAAALEGLEEAVLLSGIVGEAVRYGLTAEKNWAARQVWTPNKPISWHLEGKESRLLPLGLKMKLLPTREKVVSGGEVVNRSSRETGHMISRKVEAYSLERLAI